MSLPPSPKSFYEQYAGDTEEAKMRAYEYGRSMGQNIMQAIGITDADLNGLVLVLNEFQRRVQGEPNARAEGSTIKMHCRGFCPVMRAALTHNIPWRWLDDNYALPMFHGLASLFVPGMRIRLLTAKNRGDAECLYLFEA